MRGSDLCTAIGLSIQVTRGTAVSRPRYSRDQGGWQRYREASLSGSLATRPDGKPEIPAALDYYDYETYTNSASRSRSGFRFGAGPAESSAATASVPLITIKCYSCDYLNDWNHGQGLIGCLDPFVPRNIPTVECAGPCAVSVNTTSSIIKSFC